MTDIFRAFNIFSPVSDTRNFKNSLPYQSRHQDTELNNFASFSPKIFPPFRFRTQRAFLSRDNLSRFISHILTSRRLVRFDVRTRVWKCDFPEKYHNFSGAHKILEKDFPTQKKTPPRSEKLKKLDFKKSFSSPLSFFFFSFHLYTAKTKSL